MQLIKELIHYNPLLVHDNYLLTSAILFLCSSTLASLKKYKIALAVLVIASLLLNFFCIQLDPFLNSWDERFHALVARNMAANPFKPMLYSNPALPYDYTNWGGNHIWLHKQPLFLWQMALSIKLFGANETAARFPSAVMIVILCFILFRIGKLLFNERVGFIAALLCASNNFILEHVSGKQQVEHNDIAFMFYITLSIWSWIEFEKSNKKIWLVWIGIFAGCAVLNKWVTGLLVFAGYCFYHFVIQKNLLTRKGISNLLVALSFALLIALPWQIFILIKYPLEAQYEYQFSSRHFFEIIEGHGESVWFYLTELKQHYSSLRYLLLGGVFIVLWKLRQNKLAMSLLFMVFIFYLFFTMAATKMTSFVMPVAPICFLLAAIAIDFLFSLSPRYKFVQTIALSLFLAIAFFQNLNIGEISGRHWRNTDTYWGKFLQNTADNTVIYKKLNTTISQDYVVAYCNQFEEIDCMYFSGITAYSYLSEEDFNKLKMSNRKIAVFNNNIPDFIRKDSTVYAIPWEYKSNTSPLHPVASSPPRDSSIDKQNEGRSQ